MVEHCEIYQRCISSSSLSYLLECKGLLTGLTTVPLHFEKVIKTKEPLTLQNLKELSMSRGSVSNCIAKYSKQCEYSFLEDAFQWQQQYLSLLFNLVKKIQKTTTMKKKKLVFKWTGYTAGDGVKQFDVEDIRHELAMALVLHAAILREMGYQKAMMAKVKDEDRIKTTTSTTVNDDIALSATMIRKAAGIYEYCSRDSRDAGSTDSETINGELESTILDENYDMAGILRLIKSDKSLSPNRPGELSMSMSMALMNLCLGDVQSMTAGRAEEKTSKVFIEIDTCNSKPQVVSYWTIAALYRASSNFYDKASSIIKHNIGELNSVNSELLDYIAVCNQLSLARCYRCMAIQKRLDKQTGDAIRCIETTLQALKFCKEVSNKVLYYPNSR